MSSVRPKGGLKSIWSRSKKKKGQKGQKEGRQRESHPLERRDDTPKVARTSAIMPKSGECGRHGNALRIRRTAVAARFALAVLVHFAAIFRPRSSRVLSRAAYCSFAQDTLHVLGQVRRANETRWFATPCPEAVKKGS